MIPSRFAFATLAVVFCLATPRAQLNWQQWTGALSPQARHESAMSFDPVGGGLLLFGGSSNSGELSDTWRWTGAAWQQLAPASVPPARYGPRLATDTGRGVIVLFGGLTFDYIGPILFVPLGDTWEWDGVNWNQRFPVTSPPPRYGHALAYDSVRDRTVLFGGSGGSLSLGDTWEWDGVNWFLRSASGPIGVQANHSMAYDTEREVVLLGDGIHMASRGTWEWDGTSWTARGPCPGGLGARIVYDEARARVVWYGGANANGVALPVGVWDWDGLAWTQRSTAVSPPDRFWHMLAYDPDAEETIAFGGRDDSQPSLVQRKNDTWRLASVYPAAATQFGAGCVGSGGALTLDSVDRPWLGTTMQIDWSGTVPGSVVLLAFGWSQQVWAGVPLPLPLDPVGMTGCSLLVSLEYAQAVATPSVTLQQNVFLPNVTSVLGVELYLQGFSFDAAANPAGLTASNGLALRLGGL